MDPSPARSRRILIDEPQRPPQKRQHGRFAAEHDQPANGATPAQRPRGAPASVIVGDRLEGAREIAAFLYGSGDEKNVRRVYHAIRRNRLPSGKDGGQLIASKAKLLAHWDRLTTSKSNGQGRDEETP